MDAILRNCNRIRGRWESEIFWWGPTELRIWIFVSGQERSLGPDGDLSLLLKHICLNSDHTALRRHRAVRDEWERILIYKENVSLWQPTRALSLLRIVQIKIWYLELGLWHIPYTTLNSSRKCFAVLVNMVDAISLYPKGGVLKYSTIKIREFSITTFLSYFLS